MQFCYRVKFGMFIQIFKQFNIFIKGTIPQKIKLCLTFNAFMKYHVYNYAEILYGIFDYFVKNDFCIGAKAKIVIVAFHKIMHSITLTFDCY